MSLSYSPYATNNHGIVTRPIDFDAEGSTTSMTYHGLSISVQGNVVGRIQSWNPSAYGRDGRHVYELNNRTWGRAIDYVPGKNNAYTIECGRVEVWNQELEIALGFGAIWDDLIDQNRPFTVQEYLFRGNAPYRIWQYSGCWFQSKNPNGMEAEGDATIMVSGTIAFVNRKSVF